ncbi:unnamed protein product [Sphagnum jensenii]|uniref:Virion structural protein n=1 Tax=Sphagnum jensenii TaxID=128206 RepID=A0ABP0VHM8_9BRYO
MRIDQAVDFEDNFLELAALDEAFAAEHVALQQTIIDIKDLTKLHAAISNHGLSASLLSFINPDNNIRAIIPGIPSMETYAAQGDDAFGTLSNEALAGVVDAVKHAISKAMAHIKETFNRIMTARRLRHRNIGVLRNELQKFQDTISDRTFDEELAKKVTAKLVRYDKLIEFLDFAETVNTYATKAITLELPTTHDGEKEWHSKLSNLSHTVFSRFPFVVDGVATAPIVSKNTYADMRYNEHAFEEIHAKIEAYIKDHLENNDQFERDLEILENKVEQQVANLSVEITHTGPNGYPRNETHMTPAAETLYDAFETLSFKLYRLDGIAYKEGVLRAAMTMRGLSRLYK